MTVAELVEKLSTFPPYYTVVVYGNVPHVPIPMPVSPDSVHVWGKDTVLIYRKPR